MIYSVLYSLQTFSGSLAQAIGSGLAADGYLLFLFMTLGFKFLFFTVGFLFRGFALYRMSVRSGLGKAWFAFVPFLALYLMGELQGKEGLFAKYKALGLAAALTAGGYVLALGVLDGVYGIPLIRLLLEGKALIEEDFAVYGLPFMLTSLANICSLATIVLTFILCMNLYKIYNPQKASALSVWAIVFDVLFSSDLLFAIFLFSVRNNERGDYGQYLRERAARYRASGGFGNYRNGNAYGNPFGNYGDTPYGNNRYGESPSASSQKPAEDPFSEFSDKKTDESDPFADFNSHANEQGENKQDPAKGSDGGNTNDGNDLFS